MSNNRNPNTIIILALLLGIICTIPPAGASLQGDNLQMEEINPVFLEWKNQQKASLERGICMNCDDQPLGDIPSPVVVHWPAQRAYSMAFDGDADYPTEPYFNLADEGRVTAIRDQGSCGSCWTFASLASLESWLLSGETWDFSENNLKNLHGFDPSPCEGGNADMAIAYLARWDGPVLEADDPYSESDTPNSPTGLDVQKHLQEAVILPARISATDNGLLKQMIKEQGGLYGAFTVDWSYFNSTNGYLYETYYNPDYQSTGGHAVCIVGWDDTFSASNFAVTPPGDGAFICKNSWGTGVGWNGTGYFYLSYYDANFAVEGGSRPNTCYFTAESNTNYDNIYQYDPLGWVGSYGYGTGSGNWMANVFTAESDEELNAVSFYATTSDVDYDIWVYVNPSELPKGTGDTAYAHTSGTLSLPGYYTVPLSESVSLDEGDTFSVIVQFDSAYEYPIAVEFPDSGYSSDATASGKGYVCSDGSSWSRIDLVYSGTDVCLKAFTDDVPLAADFSADTTSGEAPLTVQFTDESTGEPSGYAWDFTNDGSWDSYEINPQYTYETPGTFSVRHYVADGEESDIIIKSDYITVTGASDEPDDLIGVWRNGVWILDSNDNHQYSAGIDSIYSFGKTGDIPIVGDWDANNEEEIAVWRNGLWILDNNGNGQFNAGIDEIHSFGKAGDVPLVADLNDDSVREAIVWRNGIWIVDTNNNFQYTAGIDQISSFGKVGDIPITGDWNSDGCDEFAVFRNGVWILDMNGDGVFNAADDQIYSFGKSGDVPVAGDWNDDGAIEIGVYRNGLWILDINGDYTFSGAHDVIYSYGTIGDIPVVGDWN